MANAARRHTGQHPQPSGAARDEHSEDRPGRRLGRRIAGDQDPRGDGRSADHLAAGTAAGRDAACVRQEDGSAGRRRVDVGHSERLTDDLSIDGRQYIIVAVSGGAYSGEYLAFAPPQTETRPTQQQ